MVRKIPALVIMLLIPSAVPAVARTSEKEKGCSYLRGKMARHGSAREICTSSGPLILTVQNQARH